jgi:hypothetical protein
MGMEELAPIFVLILVLLGVMIATYLSSDSTEESKKPDCTLHDWVLDNEEKLVCTECGFKPQTEE